MPAPLTRPGLALARSLTACAVLAGCDLLTGCSVPASSSDAGTQDSGQDTGATTPPTTGEPHHCIDADDCPPAALCEHVRCIDDACVYTDLADGDPDDDAPGDCRSHVCDGKGGGTPIDDPADLPDDGNSCTVDVCDPGPMHTVLDPGSACDGGYCHADSSCQPCAEREGCDDTSPAEPNQTQSNAHPLAQVSDNDPLTYQCEALGDAADVDWFRLDAVDSVLGTVAPAVVIDPPELAVCVYFQCKSAGTGVTCPDDTVAANAPLGQQGCCGHGSFAPDIDCQGREEDASVWLVVRRDPEADAPSCINYQLGYEY